MLADCVCLCVYVCMVWVCVCVSVCAGGGGGGACCVYVCVCVQNIVNWPGHRFPSCSVILTVVYTKLTGNLGN